MSAGYMINLAEGEREMLQRPLIKVMKGRGPRIDP